MKRTATSLSWYPESSRKLAVAYSILEFQQFAGETCMDSYIWDIGKAALQELFSSFIIKNVSLSAKLQFSRSRYMYSPEPYGY